MSIASSIEHCLRQPVIPVVWDPSSERDVISRASVVLIQGGAIADLPRILHLFDRAPLNKTELLVHIDLVSGLENNEAGLELLAQMPRIRGIVTVHEQLVKPASRLNLLSVVRFFLQDTRAVSRAVAIASKSKADAIELLPAVAAVQTANAFRKCRLPRIAGGLCHTTDDIQKALDSGCQAVTSTRPALWRFNA
ncbi:MAG: glycerol-3-phosphate responsive antiterminator [Pirellulales bacterium]|nr:glycerol-3-phosphate responsive antiterminator [Pirellulales bacterium]